MWKHGNCSSTYLIFKKKNFNSKALKTDISVLVILQSADKSLSNRVTNHVQPSLYCRISGFKLISPQRSFLLCGYITFSPQEWGKLRWDPSNALSAAQAGYCHGGPGQTPVFRWAPNVLVSHWMIVGSGIYRGGNEYKVKCVAVKWPTVRNKGVEVCTASHHQRELKCLGALVFPYIW